MNGREEEASSARFENLFVGPAWVACLTAWALPPLPLPSTRPRTMSSRIFTPRAMSSNPRDWLGEIGLLNAEHTAVTISLADLLRWLRTLSVEIDPNMSQLKQLPKFAQLGTMAEAAQAAAAAASAPTPGAAC